MRAWVCLTPKSHSLSSCFPLKTANFVAAKSPMA